MVYVDDDEEIEHIYLDDEDHSPVLAQGDGVVAAVDNARERQKLKRLLIGIIVTSLLLSLIRGIEPERVAADFMAVFFIAFAALKFADIEAYAQIYSKYDIIARKFQVWGFILPFILAFMGFWYLLSEAPTRLNVIAIIVTGISLLGAVQASSGKNRRQYAYHKTFLRQPFTKIYLLENSVMFAMAIVSQILN